ncbi:MAG: glycerol-3-phosphate dehydrogenase [Novosphingobium sp. 16-62-11]|nr:MAG: glycerol-3-phosphate dehydrogenase [Novosphingobium sp. 16-62-11]
MERLERDGDHWRIETAQGTFCARSVINAAGPSVLTVLGRSGEAPKQSIRLVRGSHIVVPKLFDHPHPYFFQLPDGRIFFAIPYEHDYTLIGTTDRDHVAGQPIVASDEEVAYLCEGASRFFSKPVMPADVVWSYSGVRPLMDDGSGKPEAATRGYTFEVSDPAEGAPILSVFGGKITTFRTLSEEAVDRMGERIPALSGTHWTDCNSLPGGDFGVGEVVQRIVDLQARYPFLAPAWAERLFRNYGTLATTVLGDAATLADCGEHFGHGLTEREVRYLVSHEWAREADDVLWRRTKLGLRLPEQQQESLRRFMRELTAP